MQFDLNPGKYVVAVSGGVDSMVLLHMLRRVPGLTLTVAHFEHGIRPDSDKDRQLVEKTAQAYGLPFVLAHGKLGASASEATAREARYTFLYKVCADHGAKLITAHHQDDLLETAVINILRGTGPRGLASLRSGGAKLRPLLKVAKAELLAYARQHNLDWHEDTTNDDPRYLRNYIRKNIMPRFNPEQRATFLGYIQKAGDLQAEVEAICAALHSLQPAERAVSRYWFIMLPHKVAGEYLADWLRSLRIPFDRPTIERLVIFMKTAAAGKIADIQAGYQLKTEKNTVEVVSQSGQ